MDVRRIPVSEIRPNPDNPRADLRADDQEYKAIKQSIEVFGFVEPLVWNERSKRLVSGHQRFEVLQERGVTEVDVSVVDLDEDQETILGIALNKIEGEWDDEKLAQVLQKIARSELDVGVTGFDEKELEGLLQWKPVELEPTSESEPKEKSERKDIECPHCGFVFPK